MRSTTVVRNIRTPRRRLVWARVTGSAIALVANTADRQDLLASFKTSSGENLQGWTVMRTHLHFYVFSTALINITRSGLVVEDVLNLSTAASSGPLQKPNRDWFGMITSFTPGSAAATTFNLSTSRLNDYDFRSKRKLTETSTTVSLMTECSGAASYNYAADILLAMP